MAKTLVLHSTEGSTIEGAVSTMQSNRSSSNWVADPRPEVNRLVTLSDSEWGDRSLRNRAGGVETNNRPGVWQMEIVGYAKQIPYMSDAWYRNLARMVIQVAQPLLIPLVFPCEFVAYPASYGLHAAQRLSFAAWESCSGIVGHQHVPENDHGDPGGIGRLAPFVIDMSSPIREVLNTMADVTLIDLPRIAEAVELMIRAYRPKRSDREVAADVVSWTKDLSVKAADEDDGTEKVLSTLRYIEWILRTSSL